MAKPQTQATITMKTLTKIYSKAPIKKQGSAKTQTVYKQKPEHDPTDSDASSNKSDPEPIYMPHRKRAKQSVDDDMDIVDDEPEVIIDLVSGGSGDDAASSSDNSEV
jgi:hypothetical protein